MWQVEFRGMRFSAYLYKRTLQLHKKIALTPFSGARELDDEITMCMLIKYKKLGGVLKNIKNFCLILHVKQNKGLSLFKVQGLSYGANVNFFRESSL